MAALYGGALYGGNVNRVFVMAAKDAKCRSDSSTAMTWVNRRCDCLFLTLTAARLSASFATEIESRR